MDPDGFARLGSTRAFQRLVGKKYTSQKKHVSSVAYCHSSNIKWSNFWGAKRVCRVYETIDIRTTKIETWFTIPRKVLKKNARCSFRH